MSRKSLLNMILALLLILSVTACNANGLPESLLNRIYTSQMMVVRTGIELSVHEPIDKAATLAKIIGWVHKSSPYTSAVPKSDCFAASAYIGPPVLQITDQISITPAGYYTLDGNLIRHHDIINVVALSQDGNTTYLYSKELYDWLKNDRWKSEFQTD